MKAQRTTKNPIVLVIELWF